MTAVQSLAARAALGGAAAAATVLLPACRRFYSATAAQFDRTVTAGLIASRAALFLLVFVILHIAPRGDVVGAYFYEAHLLLAGFHFTATTYPVTSYAPLHPYMDAALLHLHDSPLTLIAFAILVEWLAFTVWLRIARAGWPDSTVRCAALLYLFSPLSLQFVAVDGQDNIVIALLLGLAVLLAVRRREILSGFALALSIDALKFLPLLYVPVFWLLLQRRWRWLLALAAGVVTVYGAFALCHVNLLSPLREGALKTAGGMPFLLESIGDFSFSRVWDVLLLLCIGVVLALLFRAAQARRGSFDLNLLVYALAASTLVLIMMAKKTWPPYTMMVLFPLCLLVALQPTLWRRIALAVFSWVAVLEHSYYESVSYAILGRQLHSMLVARSPVGYGLFSLEVLLVAGYLWLLMLALKAMTCSGRSVSS